MSMLHPAGICAAFLLAAWLPSVAAAERARVLSAQPVQEQVGVPQQVCGDETEVIAAPANAPAGTQPTYATTRRCKNELVYEQQIVGWDVSFHYAGQNHSMRVAKKPGQWIDVPAHLVAENPKTSTTKKIAAKSNKTTAPKTSSKTSIKTSPKTTPQAAPRNQWDSEAAAAGADAPRRARARSVGTSAPDAAKTLREVENAAAIVPAPTANLPQGVNVYYPAQRMGQNSNNPENNAASNAVNNNSNQPIYNQTWSQDNLNYPANNIPNHRTDGVREVWIDR